MAEVLQFTIISEHHDATAPAHRLQCELREVALRDHMSKKRRRFSVTSVSSSGDPSKDAADGGITPLLAAVLAPPPATDTDAAVATRTAAVRAALAATPAAAAASGRGEAYETPPQSPRDDGAAGHNVMHAAFAEADGVSLSGSPLHAAALAAAAHPRACAPALELLAGTLPRACIDAGVSTPQHPGSPFEGATALHLLMLFGAQHAPTLHHAVRALVQAGADRWVAALPSLLHLI